MTDPIAQSVLDTFQDATLTYAGVALILMAVLMVALLVEYRTDPDTYYAFDDELAYIGVTPAAAVALIALAWPGVLWHLARDHGRIDA